MTLLVGIGDLHLDGPLCKLMDGGNEVMLGEVESIIEKGMRKGATGVIFYGDLCHRSRFSKEGEQGLIRLLAKYTGAPYKLEFYIVKGNHDHESNEDNSLSTIVTLVETGLLKRTTLAINKSITVTPGGGIQKVRLCPWPNTDVSTDAVVNVIHVEVAGSKFDNGREVPGDHVHTIDKKRAVCVAGHMHTPQTVGNVDYVGTPYQTTFAESPEKYWHLIDLVNGKIKKIKHKAQFELRTCVIESRADAKNLPTDNGLLIRLLVKNGLDISSVSLPPNVVKHSGFSNKKELKTLIEEGEVEIVDEDLAITAVDPAKALEEWMHREQISPELQKKVIKMNRRLTSKEK